MSVAISQRIDSGADRGIMASQQPSTQPSTQPASEVGALAYRMLTNQTVSSIKGSDTEATRTHYNPRSESRMLRNSQFFGAEDISSILSPDFEKLPPFYQDFLVHIVHCLQSDKSIDKGFIRDDSFLHLVLYVFVENSPRGPPTDSSITRSFSSALTSNRLPSLMLLLGFSESNTSNFHKYYFHSPSGSNSQQDRRIAFNELRKAKDARNRLDRPQNPRNEQRDFAELAQRLEGLPEPAQAQLSRILVLGSAIPDNAELPLNELQVADFAHRYFSLPPQKQLELRRNFSNIFSPQPVEERHSADTAVSEAGADLPSTPASTQSKSVVSKRKADEISSEPPPVREESIGNIADSPQPNTPESEGVPSADHFVEDPEMSETESERAAKRLRTDEPDETDDSDPEPDPEGYSLSVVGSMEAPETVLKIGRRTFRFFTPTPPVVGLPMRIFSSGYTVATYVLWFSKGLEFLVRAYHIVRR